MFFGNIWHPSVNYQIMIKALPESSNTTNKLHKYWHQWSWKREEKKDSLKYFGLF
jgi:hypothetical protein